MTRLAIIADDLSSATDCGAQIVRSGLSVIVPLGGYTLPEQIAAAQVIAVDTDSRGLAAGAAYTKVRAATEQLVADGWTHFYKSVDSTLRGNLGAEIEAMLEVIRPDCAIVAPAFPKYGRTTVNGVQNLHGRPLHETEFGTDPTAPVKDADIARRLAEGSPRKSGRLTLEQLRAGTSAINRAVQAWLTDGAQVIIVDVAEQADLRRICQGLSRSELNIVWVGSTGLAEFIPLAFGEATSLGGSSHDQKIDLRPALALVGSASETTRQQLLHAQAHQKLQMILLDPARLIQEDSIVAAELDQAGTKLCAALDAGSDVALVVNSSRDEIARTQQLGAKLDLSIAQVAQRIVNALAQSAYRLVREDRVSGMVATGGDTANALCAALNAQALEILGVTAQ